MLKVENKFKELLTHKSLHHCYNVDEIPSYRDKSEYIHTIEYAAVEQLKAENNDLKRELADKNKYGCCIVEHGYRIESEQCLKDITKQLENSRTEITALKSKLKIAVEALQWYSDKNNLDLSQSVIMEDGSKAKHALSEIGGEI